MSRRSDVERGCGPTSADPSPHANRPGLSAIAYRISTHGEALGRMLDALHRATPGVPVEGEGARPLSGLGTRRPDDPAIAFLDAAAMVTDVLAFYQERIAQEGFLRTATERRSVLELARTIGYELKPGVAASTELVFTVEDAPGSPATVEVAAGTQVLSVPTTKEDLPQTFETAEALTARRALNALRVPATVPQVIARSSRRMVLEGTGTGLRKSSMFLIVEAGEPTPWAPARWAAATVSDVVAANGQTEVRWTDWLAWHPDASGPDDAFVAPAIHAVRVRAALFGHSAPDWWAVPEALRKEYQDAQLATEWPTFNVIGPPDLVDEGQEPGVDLAAVHEGVQAPSWALVVDETAGPTGHPRPALLRVREVTRPFVSRFRLSGKVTRLHPDAGPGDDAVDTLFESRLLDFGLRESVAWCQSEALELAPSPDLSPVEGEEVIIDGVVDIDVGRRLVVSGHPSSSAPALDTAATQHEATVVIAAGVEDGRTRLSVRPPLTGSYQRASLRVFANVTRATHGETAAEVVGSGDGSTPHQAFALAGKPLTFVPSTDPSGAATTLEIRVNGVRWHETTRLDDLGPQDRRYLVRIADGGAVRVVFGDGTHGARLPTGVENVHASYRSGIGFGGEVEAGTLTVMKARPLGIREVRNPRRATGAADPEARDAARENAPRTVLTLERVVSLTDYEDYARGYPGIGKAQATPLWSDGRRGVHLTVATASGAPLPPGSELGENLEEALLELGDPHAMLWVEGHREWLAWVRAGVLVHPDHVPDDVLAAVRATLSDAFSFPRRGFAQPLTAAEIVEVAHTVPGVVAVDLDELYLDGVEGGDGAPRSIPADGERGERLTGCLPARRARHPGEPAELILLRDDHIELEVMA